MGIPGKEIMAILLRLVRYQELPTASLATTATDVRNSAGKMH